MPLEYSAVRASAPNAAMNSCPTKKPVRLMLVGSNVARLLADVLAQCAAAAHDIRQASPTVTTTRAISVR
jgi:hypothetical protein